MISISHWGLFSAEHLPEWARDQLLMQHRILPYFDVVFPGGKTGREIARENLRLWAERASA